jgi:hypothetical protein
MEVAMKTAPHVKTGDPGMPMILPILLGLAASGGKGKAAVLAGPFPTM